MKVDDTKEIHGGEFVVVRITEDLYDQAVELFQKYFMKYENVCTATNLLGSQESIDEMESLIRTILKDGVSFAIIEVKTNLMVAMCVNKILNPSEGCTLDSLINTFCSPSMITVGAVLDRLENTFDLFKEWNVDCVLELYFLSTRIDYGKKRLGAILSKHTIEFAKHMLLGTLQDKENLPDHIRNMKPQAICSVLTSKYSQQVAEKLGFETLVKVPYKEFEFEGKSFAETIDAVHEFCEFSALRI